jgi:hypothetical protein
MFTRASEVQLPFHISFIRPLGTSSANHPSKPDFVIAVYKDGVRMDKTMEGKRIP